MSFQQSYETELRHIRETAKDYAKLHPSVAPFLENWSNDQDVERLIEAFAFLTAKVQKRIEDGIPEIGQNILRMVWPNALSPMPSHSIVAFNVGSKLKTADYLIEKGHKLHCEKSGQNFSFETLHDVKLYPLELKDVRSDLQNDKEKITLDFKFLMDSHLGALSTYKLPLYFASSHPNALMLGFLLKENVLKTSVTDQNGKVLPVKASLSASQYFERAGIDATQPDIFKLIPYYFNFIDLTLEHDGAESLKQVQAFKVEIQVALKGADYLPLNKDHLRLYAVPVKNQDKVSVSPVVLTGERHQYPLRLEGNYAESQAISKIESVESVAHFGKSKKTFHASQDFNLEAKGKRAMYQEYIENEPLSGSPMLSLSFDQDPSNLNMSVSVEAMGFSLNAHERLGIGDIKSKREKADAEYSYRNIAHVTPAIIPNYHESGLWTLMNYMSLRLNKLNSVEAFRKMLTTFNADAMGKSSQQKALTKKLCEGVFSVKISVVERLYHRHFIRGNLIEVGVKETHFLNEGEIHLFGSILNEILQSLVEVNSFNQLQMVGIEKGVRLEWPMIAQQ